LKRIPDATGDTLRLDGDTLRLENALSFVSSRTSSLLTLRTIIWQGVQAAKALAATSSGT
jgi:hypothetical protein